MVSPPVPGGYPQPMSARGRALSPQPQPVRYASPSPPLGIGIQPQMYTAGVLRNNAPNGFYGFTMQQSPRSLSPAARLMVQPRHLTAARLKEDWKKGAGNFFGMVQKMYDAGSYQPGRRYRTNSLCQEIPVEEAKARNRAQRMTKLIRADYNRGSIFDNRGSVYGIWEDDSDEDNAEFVNERLRRRSTVASKRGTVCAPGARSAENAVAAAAALRAELARPSVASEAPCGSEAPPLVQDVTVPVQIIPPRQSAEQFSSSQSTEQPSFFFDLTDGGTGVEKQPSSSRSLSGQRSAPAPAPFQRAHASPGRLQQVDPNAPIQILSSTSITNTGIPVVTRVVGTPRPDVISLANQKKVKAN